jgi:hypothetical protein
MARLTTRLPDFGDEYDGRKQRALVQAVEQQLAQIRVDSSLGAHTEAGDFTVIAEDEVVLVDTTAGNVTVTLPEISDALVREKYEVELVKKVAANTLTVLPTGTDTILGEPDAVVTVQWTALRFRAATGNWIII